MPYERLEELPEAVRRHLPRHAQEVYLRAFNGAWQEYREPEERREPAEPREQVAHKVAWAAVKREYRKDERGRWVRRRGGAAPEEAA